LPSWVDAYVSVGEPLERLAFLLRRILNGEPALRDGPRFVSPQDAA